MGMYDTLNGEQVKCFPWFSLYVSSKDDTNCCITSHGGNLEGYGNGSEIPYRSLAYNYGKDFIIFDFIPGLTTDEIEDWVAHVVEHGCLKASVYRNEANDEFEKMLKKSTKNIDYYGEENFKFKTIEEIDQYAKEANELQQQITELYKPADSIRKEWAKMLRSAKDIQKGSEEFVAFQKKIQHYIQRHNEELARIKPIVTKLRQKFAEKWMEQESEGYREMADFGECVEAGILALRLKKEQEQKSAEEIKTDKACGLFFDTEKEWRLYCEYFKKTYGKMLEKEGEAFWERYFAWCEITDEEKEDVVELKKELGV